MVKNYSNYYVLFQLLVAMLGDWFRLAGALLQHNRAPLLLRGRISTSITDKKTAFATCRRLSINEDPSYSESDFRKEILSSSLQTLHIDAAGLYQSMRLMEQNPTIGYDEEFGKPAIRTYRSFLFPKDKETQLKDTDPTRLKASAVRCARQIDFLIKRHRSNQTEWIRNNDSSATNGVERKVFPLVLLLDNVRSAFNVGSLFRTADASGCSMVLTVGITPHPQGSGSDKVRKSALGAELAVPSQHFTTMRGAIDYIRSELYGYQLIGLETTHKSVMYTNYQFDKQGVVLVLGNEVTGVDTAFISELDAIVEIPMFGIKNSLNVAACAPVVLFEVLRQWKVS